MSRHPIMVEAGVLALVGGALDHIIPPIAALLGAVWYAISIWDSPPMQRIRARWKRAPQKGDNA